MGAIEDDLIKLLAAVVLGGLIGIEREFRDKAAGFRTVIFISLGACVFTILSVEFGRSADPSRIASQIVTGVGFLGAGAILRDRGRVVGLTTAAIIWLTAAIGMAVGAGEYLPALLATLIALLILWLFPRIETAIGRINEMRLYEVVTTLSAGQIEMIDRIFDESALSIGASTRSKREDRLVLTFKAHGSTKSHRRLVNQLIELPEVKSVTF